MLDPLSVSQVATSTTDSTAGRKLASGSIQHFPGAGVVNPQLIFGSRAQSARAPASSRINNNPVATDTSTPEASITHVDVNNATQEEPSIEQDGYEWTGPRFVPKEEYPDGLISTGCNLGTGAYGTVDLYVTRERNGKWNELAVKSGITSKGRRDLHKEHFIYGKLKQWVQNNPDDPCVAAFDKIAKIYGMAKIPEPGKERPKTVLVMEKVSGCTGEDLIVELRERHARKEITHTQFIGVMQHLIHELLEVITLYRQAGFVHADMHIGNFMIDRESGNLKVLDHGFAHMPGTPVKFEPGPFSSLEYGTTIGVKEQHDVFSIGASLLWGMEFDLTTVRQKRPAQVVPGKASRWPNHGLTLPASGEKAFVIDEVTRMPRRIPGHIDAKTGFKPAFANAIGEMMHRPSDQAPDARAAGNLVFLKDRLLSDDEARELRRDLLKSRGAGQEPGKWAPREIPKRENLPQEFAWIATDLDLLKREYELESAARGVKHHKRSPEMILQLLDTRDRLLNKLLGTNYTYPASSNPDAQIKRHEDTYFSGQAQIAIGNLCRELDDLRNDIIEMASGTLDGLWEFKKDLPKGLHAIAVEAYVLQHQQQQRLNHEIRPALSSAQKSKEPVESAPANALWNYHAALQAQQRCDQLIGLVMKSTHPNLTPTGLDAINHKLLKTLEKTKARTIDELSPTNSASQSQPTPILGFPKDEFEVRHLVGQADALLHETSLTGKPSVSATRRVQVIIDTLVKLVPLQTSLTERRDREQSPQVKEVLNDLVERLEKSHRNLDNRLKEYESTAEHAFAGTKKRVDKLFAHVFASENLDNSLNLVEQANALLHETNFTGKPVSATPRVQVIIDTLVKLVPLKKALADRRDSEQSQEVKDELNGLVERLEESHQNLVNRLEEYEKKTGKKIGTIATEEDFATAQTILEDLKNTMHLTDSQSTAYRERALKDYHELAPRMANFVSSTRPILEELGLHSGFGKITLMAKEDIKEVAKDIEQAATEEAIREQYMPNSLRMLRNKIKQNSENTSKNIAFDSIMKKANVAQEFLDWYINEDMVLANDKIELAARMAAQAKKSEISWNESMSKPLPDLPPELMKRLPDFPQTDMPDKWATSRPKRIVEAFSLEKSMSKPLPDLPKPNTPGERVRSMTKRMAKIFRSENSTLEKMKSLVKAKSKQDRP